MAELPRGTRQLLKDADRLGKADPIAGYYTRLAAVEMSGKAWKDLSSNAREEVEQQIGNLEKAKSDGQVDPGDESNQAHLEEAFSRAFCEGVKADQMGSYRRAARSFRDAFALERALQAAGEPVDDFYSKARYALWRASQIASAIASGQPVPEPPPSDESHESREASDSEPKASEQGMQEKQASDTSSLDGVRASGRPSGLEGVLLPEAPSAELARAARSAQFANAALMFEDVPECQRHIQDALSRLK